MKNLSQSAEFVRLIRKAHCLNGDSQDYRIGRICVPPSEPAEFKRRFRVQAEQKSCQSFNQRTFYANFMPKILIYPKNIFGFPIDFYFLFIYLSD